MMARMRLRLLAVTSLVLSPVAGGRAVAGEVPDASAPAIPAQGGRDFDSPPPGSSEDQALWKTAHDLNNDVPLDRHKASRLQLRAKTERYDERLEALARQGSQGAEQAGSLRPKLEGAWTASSNLLLSQWPVDPTRVCRYPLLTFEGVMYSNASPRKAPQLDQTRQELRDCVSKAQSITRALVRSNGEFEQVLAVLDRELPPLVPTAGAPAPRPSGERAVK
jgi:hypothetical protein